MTVKKFGIIILWVIFGLVNTAMTQTKDIFKQFQQIIPRGRIAAIVKPKFVPANKAKVNEDSWIFGVEIDGQTRAYSLSLLNSHEVVNDKIGETNFAAVW